MKTKFYLDGKKTTKKALIEKIGKERLDLMVGEAKEGFFTDPLEQQSFYLGSAGMLTSNSHKGGTRQ